VILRRRRWSRDGLVLLLGILRRRLKTNLFVVSLYCTELRRTSFSFVIMTSFCLLNDTLIMIRLYDNNN